MLCYSWLASGQIVILKLFGPLQPAVSSYWNSSLRLFIVYDMGPGGLWKLFPYGDDCNIRHNVCNSREREANGMEQSIDRKGSITYAIYIRYYNDLVETPRLRLKSTHAILFNAA